MVKPIGGDRLLYTEVITEIFSDTGTDLSYRIG
jgi:hypothetical protein